LARPVKNETNLDRLTAGGMFRLDRLHIDGIDHEPVFKPNVPKMVEQKTCLFHRDISSGERGFFTFLRKSKNDDSAIGFPDFLATSGIEITGNNHIPFLAVYAYLVTDRFVLYTGFGSRA
jgi:hypothetical protein